jgi:hypothetical protein
MQCVKTIARNIHILRAACGIQLQEHALDALKLVRSNATWISIVPQTLERFAAE